jgi:GH18 family chitinase
MKRYTILLLLILTTCTNIPIEAPSSELRINTIPIITSGDTLKVFMPYEEPEFKVIAYTTSWSNLQAKDIRYSLLTHINFCFLLPAANGDLRFNNLNISRMKEVIELAHQNHVRVFISIGGWDIGDGGGVDIRFERMVANQKAVNNFVKNVSDFVKKYNLDGVDIDWEYPDNATLRAFGQKKKSSEYYLIMMKLLQAQLKEDGKGITSAVISRGNRLGDGILNEVFDTVDWINVMAYDDSWPEHSSYKLAEECWEYWVIQRGLSPSKFVLGLPFYGKFPWKTYKELIAVSIKNANRDYSRSTAYNGIPTIRKKTRFVIEKQGRGVMFWELSGDTFDKSTSLLAAINKEVQEKQ